MADTNSEPLCVSKGDYFLDHVGMNNGNLSNMWHSRYQPFNELAIPFRQQSSGAPSGLNNCFNCGEKHLVTNCDKPKNKNVITRNRNLYSRYHRYGLFFFLFHIFVLVIH